VESRTIERDARIIDVRVVAYDLGNERHSQELWKLFIVNIPAMSSRMAGDALTSALLPAPREPMKSPMSERLRIVGFAAMCRRVKQLSLSANDLDFAGKAGDAGRKQLSPVFIPLHISMRTVILRACGRVSDIISQPDPVAHK